MTLILRIAMDEELRVWLRYRDETGDEVFAAPLFGEDEIMAVQRALEAVRIDREHSIDEGIARLLG